MQTIRVGALDRDLLAGKWTICLLRQMCSASRHTHADMCLSRPLSITGDADLPIYIECVSAVLLQCVETDYGIPDEDDEEADAARKATGGGIAQFFAGSSANRASKRVRGSYFSDRGMTQCDDF